LNGPGLPVGKPSPGLRIMMPQCTGSAHWQPSTTVAVTSKCGPRQRRTVTIRSPVPTWRSFGRSLALPDSTRAAAQSGRPIPGRACAQRLALTQRGAVSRCVLKNKMTCVADVCAIVSRTGIRSQSQCGVEGERPRQFRPYTVSADTGAFELRHVNAAECRSTTGVRMRAARAQRMRSAHSHGHCARVYRDA
jgi:hypothetical protein